MNRVRLVVVAVVGTVVAVAAGYALFAGVLIGADVASYTSDGVTVSDLAYEDALAGADAAGYDVERVGSSGFHPAGINELDADLGPDYEAFRVTFDHSASTRLSATFYAEEGLTVVTLFADDAGADLTVEDLPPEEWLLDRLTLLFEMDDATAAAYVDKFETAVSTGDPTEPGASTPSVEVDEPVAFRTAYDDLTTRATAVDATATPGSGWHERVYRAGDERLGSAEFVLSRAIVTHEVDGYTYRVHVDYHGGVAVDAQTRASREFEADAVRAAFREIFEAMGIPPKTADHVQFSYRGSVW